MWRLRGREKYISEGEGKAAGDLKERVLRGDQGVDGNIKMNLKEKMGGCEKDSSDS